MDGNNISSGGMTIEYTEVIKKAKIKVIGVGGCGGNAVNTMIQMQQITGVDFVAINTDVQALDNSRAEFKLQIGQTITRGLGAGAEPDVGRRSALEDIEKIKEMCADTDMVFITAGMGGGTGTGAAPVIAEVAKESGALTVGVVTKPFLLEGKKRMRVAEAGTEELKNSVDSLIVIPNQRLMSIAGKNLTTLESYKLADDVLHQAVQGISDIIVKPGYINVDFADVRAIMSQKGRAIMGTGMSEGGDGKVIDAVEKAISSPLIEEGSIEGATGVLVNITGDSKLTLDEMTEALNIVNEIVDDDANIIVGHVVDDESKGLVKVTVIGTGFEKTQEVIKNKPEDMDINVPDIDETELIPLDNENKNIPAYIRFNNKKKMMERSENSREKSKQKKNDWSIPAFFRRGAD